MTAHKLSPTEIAHWNDVLSILDDARGSICHEHLTELGLTPHDPIPELCPEQEQGFRLLGRVRHYLFATYICGRAPRKVY